MSARAASFRNSFAAARLGQIERDAKDVAALLDPVGRDRRDLPSLVVEPDADVAPSDVADSGALDLDHFRAHLGRQLGGERLRDQRAGRNDLDALQRPEFLGNQIFDAMRFA